MLLFYKFRLGTFNMQELTDKTIPYQFPEGSMFPRFVGPKRYIIGAEIIFNIFGRFLSWNIIKV